MKILTVNWVYKTGSTGKIIEEISKYLINKCEFVFCYERGSKSIGNRFKVTTKLEYLLYYVLSRMTGLKYATGYTSTWKLLKHINRVKPDIVHLHCPNANSIHISKLIGFLKKNKIPTVITNHAEFYYTGNCPYACNCYKFISGCGNCKYIFDSFRPYLFDRTRYEWKKMKTAMMGFQNVKMVAVSSWVESRLKLSPITKELPSCVILNGISTNKIFLKKSSDELKKTLYICDNEKIIVHVTSNFTDSKNDLKGGFYILKLAHLLPNTKFIVVGNYQINREKSISKNIIFAGNIENQELLSRYYNLADLTVITSKRETFGMACAESLCCGTPIVGFQAGGPESVSINKYSEFVEYGNIAALKKCVEKWMDFKKLTNERIDQEAKKVYSSAIMAEEYYKVYCELLQNAKNNKL